MTTKQIRHPLAATAFLVAVACSGSTPTGPSTPNPPPNVAPTVDLAVSAERQMPGTPFVFGATVTDPDGSTPLYTWTVNGQTQLGATGATFSLNVPQRADALGAYTVGVTVSDGRGGVATASRVVRALLPDRWAFMSSAGTLCTRADAARSARLLATSGPIPEPRTEIVFSLRVYDSLAVEIQGEPVAWTSSNTALLTIEPIAGSADMRIIPQGPVGQTWGVGSVSAAVDSLPVRTVHDALTDC